MNCGISNQIAEHCNEPDTDECEVCGASVTMSDEGGFDILICDDKDCNHKVWADGDEY